MNIKKKIQERGFTLQEVAQQMSKTVDGESVQGITQAALSRIINGNPTLGKLTEIASIIGCSVSELLAEEGTQSSCPHCGQKIRIQINPT